MQQSHRRPRRVAAFVAALPVASVLAVLPFAGTTSALAATGDYSGSAVLDLIHANATGGPQQLVDAGVAPAQSYVNSAGLPNAPYKGKESAAHATNVNAALGGSALPPLLVESTQTALPDNAKASEKTLIPVPASPVLDANVASTSARARFTTEGCLPVGEPISRAITKVADAALLPGAAGIGTLVKTTGLNNGAASTQSTVAISAGSGLEHRGLKSDGATQVSKIEIAGGQIVVNVLSSPVLTAEATGFPGGAKVTYTPAILKITAGGTPVITVDPGNPLPNPLALPNNPLINISVPVVTKTLAANGTSASGDTALLHVDILSAAGATPVASFDIGKTHADAKVPVGGIDCSVVNEDNPLREAQKDVSAASVNAGQTFDYTITVPNRGNADITDVKVVDTVTPSGLTLVKAVPSGTGNNPYTFELGTIAPNQTKTIVLTFKVPAGVAIGTKYKNTAHITGVYKGVTYSKDPVVDGPVVDGVGQGSCSIIASNKAASHLKVVTGETFNWFVHVFNTGAQPCTNLKVTDALEPTVSFVACDFNCIHVGPLVTWNVGTLGAGASTTLTVTVKTVATSGTLHNKAHITADGATPADPEVNGPVVTNQSVIAPPNPPRRPKTGDLAFTGLNTTTTILALLMLGLGLGVRRFSQTRRPHYRH